MRRGRLRTRATLAAAALSVAACRLPQLPCTVSSFCDGNVVVSACPTGSSEKPPSRQDCGARTCVSGETADGRFALCALDDRPSPECFARSAFCDGEVIVACDNGFAVDRTDCNTRGLLCATSVPEGACVGSRIPYPQCLGSKEPFCDGDVLMGCFGDLRGPLVDCHTSGRFCRSDGSRAACVLAPTPDPRCGDAERFCDGTRGVSCFAGFPSRIDGDCATDGKTCVSDDSYFGCR
jgi:hypothetical protein